MLKKNYFKKFLNLNSKKRFSSGYDYDLAIIGGGPAGIFKYLIRLCCCD